MGKGRSASEKSEREKGRGASNHLGACDNLDICGKANTAIYRKWCIK